MGYSTNYNIEIITDGDYPPCDHLYSPTYRFCPYCGIQSGKISGDEYIEKELINFLVGDKKYGNPFEDANKWYEHQADLRQFSLKYPKALFVLKGNGEENDDMWIKYFKDGKCQTVKAKIVFDEFDESKLE